MTSVFQIRGRKGWQAEFDYYDRKAAAARVNMAASKRASGGGYSCTAANDQVPLWTSALPGCENHLGVLI